MTINLTINKNPKFARTMNILMFVDSSPKTIKTYSKSPKYQLHPQPSVKWRQMGVKRCEEIKKKNLKKTFFAGQFYTFYEQKFSNLIPHLSITFYQGFQKFEKFRHWTSGSVGTKTVKRNEKHQYQTESCSGRQNVPKK